MYTIKGDPQSGKTGYLFKIMATILQGGKDVVVALDQSFGPGIYEEVHLLFMRRLFYSCCVRDQKNVTQQQVNEWINSYEDFYNRYEFAGAVYCCGRPEDVDLYAREDRSLFVVSKFVREANMEDFVKQFATVSYKTGVSSYYDLGGRPLPIEEVWGLKPIQISRGADGFVSVYTDNLGTQEVRINTPQESQWG